MILKPKAINEPKTYNMNYKNWSRNRSTVYLFTLFLLFTLISCSNGKKEPSQAQQLPVLPSRLEQPRTLNTEPIQSVENKTEEQPSTLQTTTEVMLNPPHGQPFHRCDIPVGAPLNAAPANTNSQTTNSQAQTTAPQVSTTPPNSANNPFAPTVENAKRLNSSQVQSTTSSNFGSKPRLNPPHGQPFHRCDIPVGSPLPNTP